ncbi:MAG: phenylalanine--tRNA ligase subunit beta [Candidatus Saccharibacteria bacterium]|nr:phenylalanine--tRNA ligase subunit beta [Candidatus Saccharibacteria bacterium]
MKVNLNSIKKLLAFELPPVDELVERINARLGGVEEVINLGEKYRAARIVQVVSCSPHPDADRLTVCLVDDGGVVADVPRNDDGLVQVVCGAPNVQADMWAVWLPPGATVPVTYDDAEPFVLSARQLRGVMSQGMLAAGDELGINDDHDGIIAITPYDMPAGVELVAGARFADVFGLDGYVLEIENKMFTHRPDCFGQLGVAREIAGIYGQQFTSPAWYTAAQEFAAGSGLELSVINEATDKVPRIMAVAIDGVSVKPSPLWLQCELVAMGGKPINTIVDITNYSMLITAQPTHAYDYDTVNDATLVARMARKGETLTLLNGKTITLTEDDIVIADSNRAIGLAGIMGGSDTEVSASTTRIIIECANFDMYAVRKTAMRHGIFTDALARFNKGQSPLQTAPVLQQLLTMIDGQQASAVCDEYFNGRHVPANIDISSQFICERLGGELSTDEICQLLTQVEIDNHSLEEARGSIRLTVPFWRTDLTIAEDIVEEVGRLYGFDRLPRELPQRRTKPVAKNTRRQVKQHIRESLVRAGANEVLTYSFVHEQVLTKAQQQPTDAFKLSNALSPDLQYYRLTVLPSLLDKVHANIKAGHERFMLFEMGKGHCKAYATADDGLPSEAEFTDMVYAAKKPDKGAPFYVVRRMVEQLGADLGIEFTFTPVVEEFAKLPVTAPFDIARSALVKTATGELMGIVGELKATVRTQFKLPEYTAAASLHTAGLEAAWMARCSNYVPLSRFPSTTRDISVKVANSVSYAEVREAAEEGIMAIDGLRVSLQPVAIYQPDEKSAHKTITLRLSLTSYEKTLSSDEINTVIAAVASVICNRVAAEIV